MKFLKDVGVRRKLPEQFVKALYDCYTWGYSDAKTEVPQKTFEDVKESLNRGFLKSVKQRGFM